MNRMYARHKRILSLRRSAILLLLLLLLSPVLIPSLLAQTGGDYDLTWWTSDGGGGTSSGDGSTLIGTIGQPDAGTLSGGPYTLLGGFWPGAPAATETPPPTTYHMYLPLVLRQ